MLQGEGLTAINFAKMGAYVVAGRQSNPTRSPREQRQRQRQRQSEGEGGGGVA